MGHDALWQALRDQGASEAYVALFKRSYSQQTAYVKADANSWVFDIGRGLKHGDRLSSLLFNCVLESCFRRIIADWARARVGFKLNDDGEALTNLRFADDVILFSSTLTQVT